MLTGVLYPRYMYILLSMCPDLTFCYHEPIDNAIMRNIIINCQLFSKILGFFRMVTKAVATFRSRKFLSQGVESQSHWRRLGSFLGHRILGSTERRMDDPPFSRHWITPIYYLKQREIQGPNLEFGVPQATQVWGTWGLITMIRKPSWDDPPVVLGGGSWCLDFFAPRESGVIRRCLKTRVWNLNNRGIASILKIARSQRLYKNSLISHIHHNIII